MRSQEPRKGDGESFVNSLGMNLETPNSIMKPEEFETAVNTRHRFFGSHAPKQTDEHSGERVAGVGRALTVENLRMQLLERPRPQLPPRSL